MSVITGTFAVGWTSALVDALGRQGYRVIGSSSYEDPFALLLHRAKNLRVDPEVLMVMTRQDVAPKHPHVDSLLNDLARTLVPVTRCRCVVIDADPDEYFSKCIAEGTVESSHDVRRHAEYLCPAYFSGSVVKRVRAPAYLADTPELLRAFVDAM